MEPTRPITVSTFGGLQIRLADGTVAQLQTHRARALFVLLLIHRECCVHREVLCSQLWPDADEQNARSQLRKALWRIRSVLDANNGGHPVLRIAEHQVGLDPARIDADCWRFADIIAALQLKADQELTRDDAQALIEAIGINQATFAAGLFDEWCLAEQELLHEARIAAMGRMVGYHRARENWEQAVQWAQRALMLDPAREDLHYAIMVCRYSMGDRMSAIRQYRQCEEVLQREFGIAPSAGLRALRNQIAETSPPA